MYPGHTAFVRESFEDATREPHGYLLIDLKQTTPDHLRLRTDVIPGISRSCTCGRYKTPRQTTTQLSLHNPHRVDGWMNSMSARVKKHLQTLRVLATAPPDVARALIRGSDQRVLKCLFE